MYPARNAVIGKTSRSGSVQQHFPHFKDKLSAWDIDSTTLSEYYSVVQDFTDLAISADQYFNPELFTEGRKPLSEAIKEFVWHYEIGNKTQYYLNTKVQQSDILFNSMANKESEEGSAPDFEDCEDCAM